MRALDWGTPAPERFDVVLVADAIYKPDAHAALLDTLASVFDENADAAAIVAFALHGNAPDADVLGFFDAAAARGLGCAKADECQMDLSASMRGALAVKDSKRALVHAWVLRKGGRAFFS